MEQILTEQYQTISRTVKDCLNDHRMAQADARAQQAFSELKRILHELPLKKVPKKLGIRAQREQKIVRSIQRLLRERPDVMVCQVDKMKTLYVGRASVMASKAHDYMMKTNAYQEITDGRCPLADNFHAVQKLLDDIVKTKGLTQKQAKKLRPPLITLELAHYHGLPKIHKEGIPLRPIIASIHAPATAMSKFLNDLLAPIYLQAARPTTFINGIDVGRQLKQYAAQGHFSSTTKFITGDVKDLYTMIPRQGALEALMRFLEKHSYHGKIGTLTINHIMRMARLILDTNCFAYNNTYYRQIRGGAMGSAFTQVLANIYMLEWEQDLIRHQTEHGEIYGRYIDDFFMTTNQTIDEFNIELEKAKKKDVNIEINSIISTSVNFLDVTIANEDGHLRTSVFHKPTAEPYILPYTSDHPRHIHRNIPYAALLRAARLCSHVDDFNSERLRIDMSLLLNNYPPNYINKQFNRFFTQNDAVPVLEKLDPEVYQRLHSRLLIQPTRREKILQQMMRDPVKFPEVLQPKIWNQKILCPRYLFDSGLTVTFRKEFKQWWKKYYGCEGSPVNDVKIRLSARTNRTLEHCFIHKKPTRELLTRMEPTTTTTTTTT